jgi:hypothetical protein
MTGVVAKSIAVLMCRGCRSNCSARAAPAARDCPLGDGRGLPDIGYHREHGAPVTPSRYTAPGWCGSVVADDGGGPGARDTIAPSKPAHKETRAANGASPRPIGAAIRLSLAAAPAVLGVQHDAARTPSRRRASVSATRCRNSLGFWFQERRSTARRSDRLTNGDPALPALTDCAHGTDNLAWKSH